MPLKFLLRRTKILLSLKYRCKRPKRLSSVTLRTEHSVDGEALGKKPFFLGMAEALSYLDSLEGVEALLVGMDGSVAQTSTGAFELL